LLLGVAILLYSGWLTLALPALSFLYYSSVVGGVLLALRFHSSRIFLALVVLFLAQQGIAMSGAAHASLGSVGAITLTATAVLVPVNLILIALMSEYGFVIAGIAPFGIFLFVQVVVLTVLAKSAETAALALHAHHTAAAFSLPGYAIAGFVIAGIVLLVRALVTRKPVDSALLWSLAAFFLSIRFVGVARSSTTYSATAACILAVSIIETSYLLAYHDELTTLPSRRAFNDALLRLQAPYSIAAVDIDHFKRFNDTYGHDTGDQVLKLVASKLARVTGGGEAFRCGGEEFVILFPGKTTAEVKDHLEQLRKTIENAEFHQRGIDRRHVPRGPDRRGAKTRDTRTRGRARKADAIRRLAQDDSATALSVTVSIGVASSAIERYSTEKSNPDVVLQSADKALYRAKANGRNRLETAPSARRRDERKQAADIA
jgi:GGDEF domain-containing protein